MGFTFRIFRVGAAAGAKLSGSSPTMLRKKEPEVPLMPVIQAKITGAPSKHRGRYAINRQIRGKRVAANLTLDEHSSGQRSDSRTHLIR